MDDTERPALERLGPPDVAAALTLSDEAGWNQTADDWMAFLTAGTVFGLRDDASRLVATAALMPYPPAAWISMVLVTASARRRGFATRLVEACIAAAEAAHVTPWLDATPAGETVYGPMGFHTSLSVRRFRRQRDGALPPPAPDAVDEAGRLELLRRDQAAMGFDRSALLDAFCARPGSRLYRRDSAVCLVRDGRKARQIGPLYADQPGHAIALLDAIVGGEGGSHIIDVIETRQEVADDLAASGFVFERPFRRMRFHNPAAGGHRTAIAIAGPEFG